MLKTSLGADYVVLGGGNVKKLRDVPRAVIGDNENAFIGGLLIWGQDMRSHPIVDIGTAAGSGSGKAPAVARYRLQSSPET